MLRNRFAKNGIIFAILYFSLSFFNPQTGNAAYSFRTQDNNQTINNDVDLANPVSDQESSPEPSTRRRIVDPDKFPKKSPLPARIILAPFRAIEPYVNGGVTYAEKRFFDPGRI